MQIQSAGSGWGGLVLAVSRGIKPSGLAVAMRDLGSEMQTISRGETHAALSIAIIPMYCLGYYLVLSDIALFYLLES